MCTCSVRIIAFHVGETDLSSIFKMSTLSEIDITHLRLTLFPSSELFLLTAVAMSVCPHSKSLRDTPSPSHTSACIKRVGRIYICMSLTLTFFMHIDP